MKKSESPIGYKPHDLKLEIVQVAFTILAGLPMRREIKHDLNMVAS